MGPRCATPLPLLLPVDPGQGVVTGSEPPHGLASRPDGKADAVHWWQHWREQPTARALVGSAGAVGAKTRQKRGLAIFPEAMILPSRRAGPRRSGGRALLVANHTGRAKGSSQEDLLLAVRCACHESDQTRGRA
jgi:hypothetical protein